MLIEKCQTLHDGGLKLSVVTRELMPEEMAVLFELVRKEGYMFFSEREIKIEDLDVPSLDAEFPNAKSPSERLRSCLYVLHEKKGGKKEDFEAFRIKQMERLIERIKEEIKKYE